MMILSTLKEFCETTSIHGLGFIVKANTSLVKRTAWFVIFLISISYAGIQLKESVESKFTYFMLWQNIIKNRINRFRFLGFLAAEMPGNDY